MLFICLGKNIYHTTYPPLVIPGVNAPDMHYTARARKYMALEQEYRDRHKKMLMGDGRNYFFFAKINILNVYSKNIHFLTGQIKDLLGSNRKSDTHTLEDILSSDRRFDA